MMGRRMPNAIERPTRIAAAPLSQPGTRTARDRAVQDLRALQARSPSATVTPSLTLVCVVVNLRLEADGARGASACRPGRHGLVVSAGVVPAEPHNDGVAATAVDVVEELRAQGLQLVNVDLGAYLSEAEAGDVQLRRKAAAGVAGAGDVFIVCSSAWTGLATFQVQPAAAHRLPGVRDDTWVMFCSHLALQS